MIAGGSTYFLLACVVVAAMALVGLGTLFVRAENIELPNLVAACTLVGCIIAMVILAAAARTTLSVANATSWTAIVLSFMGFAAGRVWDLALGARDKLHHDSATLDADLAD